MAKEFYIWTRFGFGWRAGEDAPSLFSKALKFTSRHGYGYRGAHYKGGGVSPPYPAPTGYQWSLVAENTNRVVEDGSRVIAFVRAA